MAIKYAVAWRKPSVVTGFRFTVINAYDTFEEAMKAALGQPAHRLPVEVIRAEFLGTVEASPPRFKVAT